jgi:transposase-like protein
MVTKIVEIERFRDDVRRLYADGVSYADMGRRFGMHRQQIRQWVAGMGPTKAYLRFLRPEMDLLLQEHGLDSTE